jgi:hypothetical protein
MEVIDYNGRRFRKVVADPKQEAPETTYRQDGDIVWAELTGGGVRRGSLTGLCAEDGTIDFAYTMVLASGAVISGHSVNTPEVLADGRIQLNERWERFGEHAQSGTSSIVEVVEIVDGSS